MRLLNDRKKSVIDVEFKIRDDLAKVALLIGEPLVGEHDYVDLPANVRDWISRFLHRQEDQTVVVEHKFWYLAASQFMGLPEDIILTAFKLMVWYFYFDDSVENIKSDKRAKQLIRGSKNILARKNPKLGAHPTFMILDNIVRDLEAKKSILIEIFRRSLCEYLHGCELELGNGLTKGRIFLAKISTEKYLNHIRSKTIGVQPCLDLIRVGLKFESAMDVPFLNAQIKKIDRLVIDHEILTNDIFGIERDLQQKNPNSIFLYARENGLTIKNALRDYEGFANAKYEELSKIINETLRNTSGSDRSAIQCYCNYALRNIRAIVDWYILSSRYARNQNFYHVY